MLNCEPFVQSLSNYRNYIFRRSTIHLTLCHIIIIMNKGIKETKSDTKRIKNVSKIATTVTSEKKISPTRGKDKLSSMNSLRLSEKADNDSRKQIIQKEAKPKTVNGVLVKTACNFQKFADFSGIPSKDKGRKQSSELSIKTTEDIEDLLNRKSKLSDKKKMLDELIAREGSIEKLLQTKKNTQTVYNVEGMSATQIKESLARVDDKTAKPFSFLNDIMVIDHPEKIKPNVKRDAKDRELNPTDIDLQLSSLVRRVELNRTLLERANQRVKDINFLTERNRMISIRDMNYDEESFLKIKDAGDASKEPVSAADLTAVSHPAVEELQKTMSSTIEMLGYVHKMSTGDLAAGEIPAELTDYLRMPIIARENI